MKKFHYYILPVTIVLTAISILILDSSSWFSPQYPIIAGQKAMKANNYIKAIREFSKAQHYCETDINARFQLGMAYHNYGWNDEALKQYDSTWNLAVINGGLAKYNSAKIWMQKRNPAKAVECYSQALTLLNNDARIWFDLSIAWQQLNRYKLTVVALEKAIKLDPKNQYYLNSLITLKQKLKNNSSINK